MVIIPKVEVEDKSVLETGFEFILHAATSMVGNVNQPTITYLNQGQTYKLSLKKDAEFETDEKSLQCQVTLLVERQCVLTQT